MPFACLQDGHLYGLSFCLPQRRQYWLRSLRFDSIAYYCFFSTAVACCGHHSPKLRQAYRKGRKLMCCGRSVKPPPGSGLRGADRLGRGISQQRALECDGWSAPSLPSGTALSASFGPRFGASTTACSSTSCKGSTSQIISYNWWPIATCLNWPHQCATQFRNRDCQKCPV